MLTGILLRWDLSVFYEAAKVNAQKNKKNSINGTAEAQKKNGSVEYVKEVNLYRSRLYAQQNLNTLNVY